jgi:predicted transposase/invertase (TIGR01784 family)
VVLFGSRELEPSGLVPYQPLLDAGMLRRVCLDELPENPEAPLGWAILHLIGQAEEQAPASARDLVARARSEINDDSLRSNLVQLIEMIIIYKLPRLSREIQTMLKVHDIRESRVYQEAREEGVQEGIEKERQRIRQLASDVIAKSGGRDVSVAELAEILGLDVEQLRKAMGKNG